MDPFNSIVWLLSATLYYKVSLSALQDVNNLIEKECKYKYM